MKNRRFLIILTVVITVLTVLAVTVFGAGYVKKMNPYQIAASKSISPVFSPEEAENFSFTKASSNNIETDPKTTIYSKMLNSIDNFDSIHIVFKPSMLFKTYDVEIELDLVSGQAYEADYSNGVLMYEYMSDGERVAEINHSQKSCDENYCEALTRADAEPIALDDRVTIADDGLPCYHYRRNVTNCPLASYTVFPQELTFSYLADFTRWEIKREDKYLDRDAVIITGVVSPYISEKHELDSFVLTVDKETGVILRLEGELDGETKTMIEVSEIEFGIDSIYQGALEQIKDADYTWR